MTQIDYPRKQAAKEDEKTLRKNKKNPPEVKTPTDKNLQKTGISVNVTGVPKQDGLLQTEEVRKELYEHYLLPLRDVVVFPGMVVPLFVGRTKSTRALELASERNNLLLTVAQVDALEEAPSALDLYDIGTLCQIHQLMRLPDGSYKVLLEGLHRRNVLHIDAGQNEDDPMRGMSVPIEEKPAKSRRIEATVRYVAELFEDYVRLQRKIPKENMLSILSLDDPGMMADQIAAHLYIKVDAKQAILAETNVQERLNKLATLLEQENEILEVEKKIKDEVRGQMDKSQKEYYLSEQIKAIQRELGRDTGEMGDEIDEYRLKIEEALMPAEVMEKADKELNRLANMAPMSPEATVVRTYLDWLVELPWDKQTKETLDLKKAEIVLEKDHYGLKKPKERILEYLAVRKLNPESRGPILCFVGPPGVGKTSLGRSIARATNRKFARISLGGMRDEAEIRGHRRTYIGSMPGRLVQTLRKVGVKNPVILLDEVDKLATDFRGDPAAALLEALDPEHNKHFSDNYLEVEFDLSQVFFITTANVLHPVAPALRDRMEIIEITSYTEEEKLQIAKQYLVPRAIKESGLNRKNVSISDEGLREIIRCYTREAGVRNLEREIQSICRKVARKVATSPEDQKLKFKLDPEKVRQFLGIPKYIDTFANKKHPDVGIATGLAWTEVGGELLNVEVSILDGKGELVLTGQLGQTMQESAKAALSFARATGDQYGIPKDFHRKYDIHIHLPEGAIPKDGPSAGVTLGTALISALSGIPIRSDIAMTGEITLRGKVLPVGGIKEKILAAHRAELKEVLIPEENRKDLEDIPTEILSNIHVILVNNMEAILERALLRNR